MFGGYVNNVYSSNRMFVISPKQFMPSKFVMEEVKVTGITPGPRLDHSMTSVSKDNKEIYVFGGILPHLDKRSNELWKFDVATSSWKLLTGSVNFD